jgi:hypothetical protein
VTEAALPQMVATPDPRLKEIGDAAVRHLRAVVCEVNLTPAEWLTGIGFLTEIGKACSANRQEFILLSDVLGVTPVVNALHDKNARELGTQSSLLPLGYSIPMDGPEGRLVKDQRRYGYRPAHIHFLIVGGGYRELVTVLYLADDEHIDSDTVFGVPGSLVVRALDDPHSPTPELKAAHYDFRLARAAEKEMRRVGADPSKIAGAAE